MLRRVYVLSREAYGRLLRVPGLARPARLAVRALKRVVKPGKPALQRLLSPGERGPSAAALSDRLAAAEREIALLQVKQRLSVECLEALTSRDGRGSPPA